MLKSPNSYKFITIINAKYADLTIKFSRYKVFYYLVHIKRGAQKNVVTAKVKHFIGIYYATIRLFYENNFMK